MSLLANILKRGFDNILWDWHTALIIAEYTGTQCRFNGCKNEITSKEGQQYRACNDHSHYYKCLEYATNLGSSGSVACTLSTEPRFLIREVHWQIQYRFSQEYDNSHDEFMDFIGQNCGEFDSDSEFECRGWRPGWHRCDCGNRRVMWQPYRIDIMDPLNFDTFCFDPVAY